MKNVLANKIHKFLGKKVEVKRALTREQSRIKLLNEKKRKIFLSDFTKKLTKGKKENIFEKTFVNFFLFRNGLWVFFEIRENCGPSDYRGEEEK